MGSIVDVCTLPWWLGEIDATRQARIYPDALRIHRQLNCARNFDNQPLIEVQVPTLADAELHRMILPLDTCI
ncbi:hypothetical protein LY76DRAFT_592536 [Colletotrichum caudatum]|nr:hypothetical protein LY76DRAFT_592536 [Colletotrichum caudatum]